MSVRKQTVVILLLSEGLLVIMGWLALSQGMRYPGSAAVMGAATMALPYLMERVGWVRLPTFVQAWISLAIGLHIIGLVWKFYDNAWWWDDLTHTVSSSLVGMLAALGLYLFDIHSLKIKVPRWAFPFMILVFSVFIGVVWETGEFMVDMLIGTHMQYSMMDTLSDLYVNVIGALITCVLWVLWLWRDPSDHLRNTAMEPLVRRFDSLF